MLGRADLHRLLGDVDVGQLLELVVHRRQPALDGLGVPTGGDVEEDAAVRTAAPRLDHGNELLVDLLQQTPIEKLVPDAVRRARPGYVTPFELEDFWIVERRASVSNCSASSSAVNCVLSGWA